MRFIKLELSYIYVYAYIILMVLYGDGFEFGKFTNIDKIKFYWRYILLYCIMLLYEMTSGFYFQSMEVKIIEHFQIIFPGILK